MRNLIVFFIASYVFFIVAIGQKKRFAMYSLPMFAHSYKDLCAAIGWLARENKIEFDDESKDQRIYLNFNPYI